MTSPDPDALEHRPPALGTPGGPSAEARGAGYWFYAGHQLTVWGLAASNVFHGLLILWSLLRLDELRRRARRLWTDPATAADARGIFIPALLGGVLFTASTFASLDPRTSLPELRDLLSWLTLFLAPLVVRGEAATRRVVDLLLAVITLLAAHGIVQYYFTDYGPLHRRIVGFFSHYQTFAGVLLIGALLLAARLGVRRRSPWTWPAFGIVLWCLLLTLTRGAWVAAAVTLGAFAVARVFRRGKPALAAALVATVLLIGVFAPTSWQERLGSIHDLRDLSNYDRLCMAEAALYMVSERPLFGLGPEVVKTRYAIYRHPTAPRIEVPHLHNSFLQRAAELGLPFLLVHLWFLAAVFWVARRRYRAEGGADGPRADLYLGAMLVVVGFAIAGFFEDNWRDTEIRRVVLFAFALPLCPGPADAPADGDARDRARGDDPALES